MYILRSLSCILISSYYYIYVNVKLIILGNINLLKVFVIEGKYRFQAKIKEQQ